MTHPRRMPWRFAWAVLLAVLGILTLVQAPSASHAMQLGAMLLMAWHVAFVPGPSLRQRPRDIYEGYRSGRHAPGNGTARLVALASMLLFAASFVVAR
jgi:hypothetical protein